LDLLESSKLTDSQEGNVKKSSKSRKK